MLYSEAKAWRCRPSELLDQEGWVAYCVDNAVWTFGTWVEEQLLDVPSHKKREVTEQRRLNRLRNILAGVDTKQYADPAALFAKG